MYDNAVTQKNSVAKICERIWLSIAEKKLRPGTRLKEEQLSEVFGVSRARVRQVLTTLEKDGLVSIIPNRGAFVAEPDVDEARDVFHLRKQTEERIIERVIERITDEQIERLKSHLLAERAAAARSDKTAAIRLSGHFHLLLAELSGSSFLWGVLHDLITRSTLITVIYRQEALHDCGPDEHSTLIEKIEARDQEGAMTCMREHLTHIENDLDLTAIQGSSHDLMQIFQ
ncbi:GntR family transcriptional regulator [Brucellaceae bacterium C25G]